MHSLASPQSNTCLFLQPAAGDVEIASVIEEYGLTFSVLAQVPPALALHVLYMHSAVLWRVGACERTALCPSVHVSQVCAQEKLRQLHSLEFYREWMMFTFVFSH